MQNLINIQCREDKNLVSARQLHQALEIGRDFTTWFKQVVERFGFLEGKDFSPNLGKSTGGRPNKDFALTPEAALCIAASQNTPKGNTILRGITAYIQQLREAANQKIQEEKELQELTKERSRLYSQIAPIRAEINRISARIKQFHKVHFPQLHLFDESTVQTSLLIN
jgi:phage anti-repressor protein